MGQLLLIPDPRPLEERLGDGFFQNAPEQAGVYLMRDAADRVVYVGKAKNLRQRLQNYRIANPDRMPRRHLRMLREVARIEFEICSGEAAALRRESKLLRLLKPRFNRVGVWPGKTRFLVWRRSGGLLELAVTEAPETGWRRHGPLGSGALHLRGALTRLLWLAIHPDLAFAELPAGWAQGQLADQVIIPCGDRVEEADRGLCACFWESGDGFGRWLESRFASRAHPFERAAIAADLEILNDFSAQKMRTQKNRRQLGLL